MDKNFVLRAAGVLTIVYGVGYLHGTTEMKKTANAIIANRLDKAGKMFARGIVTVADEAVKGNLTKQEIEDNVAQEFEFIRIAFEF